MKSQVITLLLSLIFVHFQAQAMDFQSPRTMALGGAGHAGPMLNDAIYMNPSFISFMRTYSIAAYYTGFSGEQQVTESGNFDYHGRNYNVSVQDGRSKALQAGFGYTMKELGAVFTLGASKKVNQRISVGASGKYFAGNDRVGGATAIEATASATYLPYTWLQISAIGDNIVQSDDSLSRNWYRQFTLGTKFNIQGIMMIYADPHIVPDLGDEGTGFELGAEIVVMKDGYLRFGKFENSMVSWMGDHGDGYGLGVGWVAPRLSIDYGFSRVTATRTNLPDASAHTLGATVYF